MSGRYENDLKMDEKTKQKLVGYPVLLTRYYHSLSEKTSKTKKMYILYIEQYMDFLKEEKGIDISKIATYKKIKPCDINEYLEYLKFHIKNGKEMRNGDGMRASKYYALASFFEFLIDEGLKTNPCDRVKAPRDKKVHDVVKMDVDEFNDVKFNIKWGYGTERQQKIQEKWRKRDLAIFIIGCRTGLRAAAISEIDISDVNFDERYITVTEKGNITRKCYISYDTVDVILDWMEDREKLLRDYPETDALFISCQRKRITTYGIANIIKNVTSGLDKHITTHKMRSTCASTLYKETRDIYLVANVLGHKNIQNTKRYTESSEEDQRNAADIMSNIL